MMGWNAFFVGAHPGAINGSSLSTAFAPGCALQGTGPAARITDSCHVYVNLLLRPRRSVRNTFSTRLARFMDFLLGTVHDKKAPLSTAGSRPLTLAS